MQPITLLVVFLSVAWGATIQWTGSGGTNLWDNPRNWDCGSCLPTLTDNVVIAFTLGPTFIRIGAPAKCGTLTIGGTGTTFFQTLTVSGPLTIGGGVLNTNGALLIETGNNAPFNITGSFVANGRGLSFTSGLLGGNGTLQLASGSYMNFSGPAAKEIAGHLKIDGSATIVSSSGSSIFVKEKGSVTVNGALESKTALDIIVENTASFNVAPTGSFTFNGPKLMLQGGFSLGKWSVPNGAVTVINKLTSGSLTLGASSTLSLIGAPTESRSFGSINGGTIKQDGGASSFGTTDVAGLALAGGSAVFTGQTKIGQFSISGGSVTGGSVNSASLAIDFGILSGGAVVTTASLDLRGIVSLDNPSTALVVAQSGQARVSAPSQVTLGSQTAFTLSQASTMSQSSPLKLVQASATGASPALNQNGAWTSSSTFTSLGVPVYGSGSFNLAATAAFDFTNANFSASSMNSQGSMSFQQGSINIGQVSGSGKFQGSPVSFASQSLACAGFTLTDGAVSATKVGVTNLKVQNGVFSFGTATIGTLDLQGGTVSGTPGQQSKVSVQSLVVSTAPAKTISNCDMSIAGLNLACPGTGQCALFTSSATLTTGK